MKSKYFIYVALLAVVLMSSGCGTKDMPSFALTQPEQSMTITHPDKMEESGGVIVVFTGVLPVRYMVEVENGVRGVWPLPGVSLIYKDASRINGFCYSVPRYAFDKNPWGIPAPMQCVILSDKKTLIDGQYAYALANKDGGVWIASPVGTVEGYEHTIVDEGVYDWDKFENDSEYAIELMQEIGKTIPVINEVWRPYIDGFDDVQEIAIVEGDPQWEAFRKRLLTEMNSGLPGTERGLTLPSGEDVASFLSEEEMEQLLRRNPHITPWQKFLSRLRLPIAVVDPGMMAAGLATSAINGGIAAFFDDRWDTCTARGACQRRDLSDQIVFLNQLFQKERLKRMEGEM